MDINSEQKQEFSLQQAAKLANSDAGRQLFAMLKDTGGDHLQTAMDHAAAGDLEQAKKSVQQLMQSQQVQEFIKKMRGDSDG